MVFNFNTNKKLAQRIFIKELYLSLINYFIEICVLIPTLSLSLQDKTQNVTERVT